MTPADIHWSTIGAFWSSLIAATVAVMATVINYFFFRSQIDPHVIVYATSDDRRPTIILIVIENIGKSMAKGITFSFSKPMPQDAFGFENAPQPPVLDRGPLYTGIPALGPGAKRIITWGQYGGLHKALGDLPMNVIIKFTGKSLFLGQTEYEVVCPLDIKSFEFTDDSNNNWGQEIADQLKVIAKALDRKTVAVKIEKPNGNH